MSSVVFYKWASCEAVWTRCDMKVTARSKWVRATSGFPHSCKYDFWLWEGGVKSANHNKTKLDSDWKWLQLWQPNTFIRFRNCAYRARVIPYCIFSCRPLSASSSALTLDVIHSKRSTHKPTSVQVTLRGSTQHTTGGLVFALACNERPLCRLNGMARHAE